MSYQREPDEIRRERDYLDRDYGSGGYLPAGLVFVFALVIGYVLYSGAHPTDTTPTTTSQRNERPLPPPAANPTPDTATPKQP
jgi:hypothetical protein